MSFRVSVGGLHQLSGGDSLQLPDGVQRHDTQMGRSVIQRPHPAQGRSNKVSAAIWCPVNVLKLTQVNGVIV